MLVHSSIDPGCGKGQLLPSLTPKGLFHWFTSVWVISFCTSDWEVLYKLLLFFPHFFFLGDFLRFEERKGEFWVAGWRWTLNSRVRVLRLHWYAGVGQAQQPGDPASGTSHSPGGETVCCVVGWDFLLYAVFPLVVPRVPAHNYGSANHLPRTEEMSV